MKKTLCFILLAFTLIHAKEFNAPMKTYMEGLSAEAKAANPSFTGFDAKRGEAIFLSKHTGKKGTEISCTTCHSTDLKKGGQNVNTNKPITALAPSVNSTRLTDVAEVEKWLSEGSALEKGDVLTYIINQ
ncbi:MAG: monohem cytochrome c [Proteobacteria bacterium]|nr:monohem cytochrome c [Pseudomonadota bacterium]